MQSIAELYDKCTAEEFAELTYELAEPPYKYVQIAIDIFTKDSLDIQRANRFSFLLNGGQYIQEQVDALRQIFVNNQIDIRAFCDDVFAILSCKYNKINCLRLIGPSNSGKTLIARLICNGFICSYVNNHNSENEFYLSCFLNKCICLCEELLVSQATAEDFKSILGGAELLISKKFHEKQVLTRTPIIITSNHELFGRGHLNPLDERALRNRCITYNFRVTCDPPCNITQVAFKWLCANK